MMVILQPPYHLINFIDYFWYAEGQSGGVNPGRLKLIPDGKHGVIFQHWNGHSAISEENGNPLPVGFVYGQSSTSFINKIQGPLSVFGAFFKAHAVKDIFKVDADKLVDGFVDLDTMAGYRINEVLLNLQQPQKLYEYLCDFFWKKLNGYGKTDKLVEDSMCKIQQDLSSINPGILYKHYNISRRQFQRRFKDRAGIHLGAYIRILKFQKSLQLLYSKKFDKLSDIAYTLGYADQSHFTRDFRFFTGSTPTDAVNEGIIFPENAFASNPLLQTRRHLYF